MSSWSKRALTVMLALLLIFIDIPRWVVPGGSVVEAAVSFAGGSGEAGDPYLIATAEQLDAIRLDLDSHYRLIANIDLSDYHDNGGWVPIGSSIEPFTGSLKGAISDDAYGEEGSYQISHLYMDNSVIAEEQAFIHTIGSTGLIKYVDFVDVELQTGEKSATLAVTNYGEVTHVDISGEVLSNDDDVAGIVVNNEGAMSSVTFTGHIEGASYVGGIVSRNNGQLVSSNYKGTIVGKSYVGGFAAINNGRFVGNVLSGNIDGIEYVGGMAGENTGRLSNNWYINGLISGENYVGGIVGYNRGKIDDVKSLNLENMEDYEGREVKGKSYIGGIIGYNDHGNLSNARNNGKVEGNESVGGLIGGKAGGILEHGVFNGTVTGIDDVGGAVGNVNDGSQIDDVITNGSIIGEVNVGGVVGKMDGTSLTKGISHANVEGIRDVGGLVGSNDDSQISQSSASGNVTGEEDVGGLVGDNDGNITTSSATGSVVGEYSVGGLVGDNDNHDISNSYANGDVTGIDEVGGLVGSNIEGSITNSYAIGVVHGTSSVGGLVGLNVEGDEAGIVTSSYYDLETSGQQDNEKGLGLSTENMKLVSSYDDWDFDTIWKHNALNNFGYPYHKGMDTYLTYSSNEEASAESLYDSNHYYFSSGVAVNDNIYGWSRQGFTFNGWNTESDGTGDHYEVNDYIFFMEDTMLYAQWESSAPDTVIETAPAALTNATTANFMFNASPANGAVFEYSLDGAAYVESDSQLTLTDLAEGVHTIAVRAANNGAIDATPATYTWTIDTTPPVITLNGSHSITINTGRIYNDSGATASDNHDDKITENIVVQDDVDTAILGKYEVKYNVVDTAGNQADEVIRTVRVVRNTPSSVLSSNADLAVLELRNGDESLTLDSVFTASKVSYRAVTTATELELRVQPADTSASVSYGQETIVSPVKVALQLGDNIVTLVVRAENGTEKRYTVTITRVAEGQVAVCSFTDLVGHWAMADICEASSLGIVEGISSTLFVPNAEITRTEATALLLRALGIEVEASSQELDFSDAGEIPAWAKNIIATSVTKDIIMGYPNGTFRPDQIITRAELTALVARAMKWESNTVETLPFQDSSTIPTWATGYVHSVYTRGIIEGRASELFDPNGIATRAEAAVIMLRLWKLNQEL
ncbi:MAG TPA: S-layer homology domain-containing protein [Candidatus Paenibacillus intestinavium]|nr:S-layer homology domain-containing protein [Candidatus Paenibacillus intestinavium]